MLAEAPFAPADASKPDWVGGRPAGHPGSDEVRDLIADEFEHRFRNLLAVVEAITRQALRSSGEAGDQVATLSARIAALVSANDLVRSEPKASSRIGDVVEAALAPFSGSGKQFTGGGPDVALDGGLTIALTLVLHELATDALKHGALAAEEGQVSVRWGFTGPAEDGFAFRWTESRGPEVGSPRPEGSGLRMIRRALAPLVRVAPDLQHRPAGIVFTFEAAVPEAGPPLPSYGRSRSPGSSADDPDRHRATPVRIPPTRRT